jgi:hypothetical protein
MLGFYPMMTAPISALGDEVVPQIAVYTISIVSPPARNVMKGY